MARGLDSLVSYLRRSAADAEGDDGRLLARFVAGDEPAFAALGPRPTTSETASTKRSAGCPRSTASRSCCATSRG